MLLTVLTAEESEIFKSVYADISTYVNENTLGWITGVVSVEDTWDKYVSKLKAMGVDDIVEIYQAAYNRYLNR